MIALFLCLLLAQNFDWKSLDRFAAKSKETTDINLEGPLLQMSSALLSNEHPDQIRMRKLVSGLTSIRVRSFEFAHDGEYQDADLESIRSLWKTGGWSRVIAHVSKSEGETTEVYLRNGGMAILAAERRELTVIQILGTVKLEDLRDLGGNFGIPKLDRQR